MEKTRPTPAVVCEARGRMAYLFAPDGPGSLEHLAFSVSGQPVAVPAFQLHAHEFAQGMNLLRNHDLTGSELPWHADDAQTVKMGIDWSDDWRLEGEHTGYLSIPAGRVATLEYVGDDESPYIPVATGAHYRFEGYFAKHRCDASVAVYLYDDEKTLITSLPHRVPDKSGGRSLQHHGHVVVDVVTPPRCMYARIVLAIEHSNSDTSDGAFLFFSRVRFGMAAEGPVLWKESVLSAQQVASLVGTAVIMAIDLPRPSGAEDGPVSYEITNTADGKPVEGSPICLPAWPPIRLEGATFDGVTLTGRLMGARSGASLELMIDGILALHQQPALSESPGGVQISVRIPDGSLDGGVHVLELREGSSGKTLFINAVVLKALLVSWDRQAGPGQPELQPDLHPIARRRYQSLLGHLAAMARNPKQATSKLSQFSQLGVCHETLTTAGHKKNSDWAPLDIAEMTSPEVTVILHAADLRVVHETIAGLLLSYNRTTFEIVVAVHQNALNIDPFRKAVSGARFVEAPEGTPCASLYNQAVQESRGRLVALLHTPSEPGPRWLDALVSAFDLFDDVGIAGSKIVDGNNVLYDAGGIIWSSGIGESFGRNANSEHPQANYTREADYISRLALMIDRETWQDVKGLAEDLLNGKAEDMDLALKVRAAGKKIICVPDSVVTIARSDTARSEPNGLCTEFKRRWTDTLRDYREECKPARKSLTSREGRVLFIDQRIPHADADAGSYAAVQEMRLFQALGFRVTFLPMDLAFSGQYTKGLERMGIEVIHAPFAMSVPDILKERGTEFNVVYVTRHHVARAVLPFIRKYNPDCKIVFNNADLHFLRELRVALAEKNGELLKRSKLTRDRELEVMKHCDLTITYSDVEQAVIQSHNLDETQLGKAPWVVQLANNVPPMQSRTNLGFLGSFGHRPNVDAVRFFATAVMPILRGALPGVRFNIYGSQITAEIEALQCADIVVKGQVADLAEAFDSMRLFVAPLTAGAGLKGKVLNAMAFGVPTVLSPTAAEGIGGMDGQHYCLADTPAEWVAAIGSVYDDKTKWETISNNARELVDSRYSFEQGVHTLRRSLESIGIFPPRQPQALRCRSLLPPLEQVA